MLDFTTFVDRFMSGAQAAGLREALSIVAQAPSPVAPAASPTQARAPVPHELVTYHDSCQSHNCLGLKAQGRRVLREALGVEVTELTDSAVCCGFGGSFSVDFPEVSGRVLRRKLANVEATGADTVITDNPGCIFHLRGGLHAAGRETRVLHLAEYLAEALAQGAWPYSSGA